MNQDLNYTKMSYENNSLMNTNNSNAPVKKRADKGNFKDRFSKIVSLYVPSDDADRVLLTFNDETDAEYTSQNPNTLLQTFDDGLLYQVEYFGSFDSIFGRNSAEVQTSCMSNSKMFLSFVNEAQIFLLIYNQTQLISESIWWPKVFDFSLYPTEIRCNEQFIYVSGRICVNSEKTQYLIVKYDYNENVIACTKRYEYPKFSHFDIDRDGSLIILSPKLDNKDDETSQISKLTAGFESRQYYISLNEQNYRYKPLYVASHGTDEKCWVTVQKINKETEEIEHRLMCFKCCIEQNTGDKFQLRDKLESSRWKFSGFDLGPLTTINNHVLGIDNTLHNLCHIKWDYKEGHPVIRRISSPGAPHLVQMCATDDNEVFLFTKSSVFRFRLVEELIKDSEMFV